MFTPRDILGPQGRIAARLDHYEHRDQQLQMADAVAAAIARPPARGDRSGNRRRQELRLPGPGDPGSHGATCGRRASVSRGRLDAHDQSAGATDHEGLAVVECGDSRRIHRRAGQGSGQLRQPPATGIGRQTGRQPVCRRAGNPGSPPAHAVGRAIVRWFVERSDVSAHAARCGTKWPATAATAWDASARITASASTTARDAACTMRKS